jgi:hypothetical protein
METIVIFVVLVLACVGAWLVISFLAYRRYFKAANAILSQMPIGSLYALPNEDFLRYDDAIKRNYFLKKPVSEAVEDVLHEVTLNRNPGAFSGKP